MNLLYKKTESKPETIVAKRGILAEIRNIHISRIKIANDIKSLLINLFFLTICIIKKNKQKDIQIP